MGHAVVAGVRMGVIAAVMGCLGANAASEEAKPQSLKKMNKISGTCDVVRVQDGVRLHCRPYALDRGAIFVPADVYSITIVRGGKSIQPTSTETVKDGIYGSKFKGKLVGRGLQAIFPADVLSPDSEIVVDYTGAGTAHFRFESKSLP